MQKHKPSKHRVNSSGSKKIQIVEAQNSGKKDRKKPKKSKLLTAQHIWEMYSPGPSEVI